MHEHKADLEGASATTLDRRQFVQLTGGVSAAIGLALLPGEKARAAPRGGYPFTLGIASGDPAPDGFVLWTRLAPEPARRTRPACPTRRSGWTGRSPPTRR